MLDAAALQASLTHPHPIPRATKVNRRFVIDRALFPDHVDNITSGGFRKLIQWRRGMKGHTAPLPSRAELEAELPVHTPDRAALDVPPENKVQTTWLGCWACFHSGAVGRVDRAGGSHLLRFLLASPIRRAEASPAVAHSGGRPSTSRCGCHIAHSHYVTTTISTYAP